MPRRSKVMALPRDVRRDLDAMIVERGYGDYRGLADWLRGQGHDISHVAVHRHGRAIERQIEALRLATEQARALVTAAPDDDVAVADATLRMAQNHIFQILRGSDGGDIREAAAACRALADTVRASVSLHAHRRKIFAEAAEIAGARAASLGISDDVAGAIRAAVQESGGGSGA